MSFNVQTITSKGAEMLAAATVSNKIILAGCDAVAAIYTADEARALTTRPASPVATSTNVSTIGATDNHLMSRAIFSAGVTAPGNAHSALLFGHLQSAPTDDFVICAVSSNAEFHLPSTSDVVQTFQVLFDMIYSANPNVVEATTTATYTSYAEFELLKNRTVTTHKEGDPTQGDDQLIRGVKKFVEGVFLFDTSGRPAGTLFGNINSNVQQVVLNTHLSNVEILMRDNDDDVRNMTLSASDSSIFLKEDLVSILAGNGNVALHLDNDNDEIKFSLQAGKSIVVYDLANDQYAVSLDMGAEDRLVNLQRFKKVETFLTTLADGDNEDGQFIVSENGNGNYMILASNTWCRLWSRSDANSGNNSKTEIGAEYHDTTGDFTTSIILTATKNNDIGSIEFICDEGNGNTQTKLILDLNGLTLVGTDGDTFNGDLNGLIPRPKYTPAIGSSPENFDFPVGAICACTVQNNSGSTANFLKVGTRIPAVTSGAGYILKTSPINPPGIYTGGLTLPVGYYVLLSEIGSLASGAKGDALVIRVS